MGWRRHLCGVLWLPEEEHYSEAGDCERMRDHQDGDEEGEDLNSDVVKMLEIVDITIENPPI